MGDIIQFEEHQKKTHISGPVRCLQCGHEWMAVTEAGIATGFECPKCGLERGCLLTMIEYKDAEDVWHCDCGCSAMFLTRFTVHCMGCGTEQIDWFES